MGIVDEDIQRVRESTDIVELIGEHVALRRVGRRYMGRCPFHEEKTPSFSVNQELGFYKCLAGETRVITWDGPREIRDLAGSTHRILTSQGHWIDAPFYSFGVQPLMRVTMTRNRVRKEIYATPEHRWFVRNGGARGSRVERETSELRPGDPLSWTFPHTVLKTSARLSPIGVAHGITYGDGTRMNKGSVVDLVGQKNAELLKWFPLNYAYSGGRSGVSGDPIIKVVDLPAFFKARPSLDESASYLLGWLAGYFAADGCVAADGTVILNSARKDDLEFVRSLGLRLGIGTYGITTQRRRGINGAMSDLHRVHLINADLRDDFFLLEEHRRRFAGTENRAHRRGWVVRSVEPTDRVEEVFCAVVPREHAFALEDNILTGNCFGCSKSGDAITFVREMEHLDFVDAVERLAGRAGITLRFDDQSQGKDRKRRVRLHEAVAEAIDFYHRRLLEADDAGGARRYLRGRGFDGDAARMFKLGFAPDGFDALARHLQDKKFSKADILEAGLAFENRAQRLQDQFRARLLFPIHDNRGEPVGFGGRALADDQGPKYKNSPDTVLYRKSNLLFWLHEAKAEVVARNDVVVCEGYTDVMAFVLSGVPNAVATCGTALTEEHFTLLKNLSPRITLAYDADSAGQAAAERCYQWEQRSEVQFRIADLPSGLDPADAWREDPASLARAVEAAAPFLEFRLQRLLGSRDLSTIEGRARAAEDGARLVAEHPNDLVRDQYAMELSGRLQIDIDRVRAAIAGVGKGRPVLIAGSQPAHDDRAVVVDRRELDALRWAVHAPETVAGRLDESLFADPTAHAAFVALIEAPFAVAVANSAPAVAELLERVAVEDTGVVDEDDDLAAHVVVNLVEAATRRSLSALVAQDDERSSEVKGLLDQLVIARDAGDWPTAVEATDELVTWLSGAGGQD